MAETPIDLSRLDVLRALADPTRNALYQELQRTTGPLTTGDLAERVHLHPNTVRAHLDQLCVVGLVRADTGRRGGRGRPRHRFSVVGRADPSPSAPPAAADGLAGALVELARRAGAGPEAARDVGRSRARRTSSGPVERTGSAVAAELARLEAREGYEPVLEGLGPGRWRLTYGTCPHRELADTDPEVVCALHHGTVEGRCAAAGGLQVDSFTPAQGHGRCEVHLSEVTVARPVHHRYDPTQDKEDPT